MHRRWAEAGGRPRPEGASGLSVGVRERRPRRIVWAEAVGARHAAARVHVGAAGEHLRDQRCHQLALLVAVREMPGAVALEHLGAHLLGADAALQNTGARQFVSSNPVPLLRLTSCRSAGASRGLTVRGGSESTGSQASACAFIDACPGATSARATHSANSCPDHRRWSMPRVLRAVNTAGDVTRAVAAAVCMRLPMLSIRNCLIPSRVVVASFSMCHRARRPTAPKRIRRPMQRRSCSVGCSKVRARPADRSACYRLAVASRR